MEEYLFGKIYQICKTSEHQWHLNHNPLPHSLSPLAELEENSRQVWPKRQNSHSLSSHSRDAVFYQEEQANNISNPIQLHVTEAKILVSASTNLATSVRQPFLPTPSPTE